MDKNKKHSVLQRFTAAIVVTLLLSIGVVSVFTAKPVHAQEVGSVNFDEIGSAVVDGASAAWDWATSGNDNNNDVQSFSDFKGGLTAPTGEGLDPTLTRASSAREFIINVVNFALGFLGLAALVVLVYAGILYVTAAGNEDNVGKAKKAIMYAVIGIIIIAGSYAVVNTVIRFAGSPESDRTASTQGGLTDARGAAIGQNGTGTNSAQGRIYSLGAAEIQTAMNEVVAAYKLLISMSGVFTKINNITPPENLNQHRAYIAQISNWMTDIKNKTNPLSHTSLAATALLNEYFVRFTSLSDSKFLEQYPANAEGGKKLQNEVAAKLLTVLAAAPEDDFNQVLDNLIGPKKQSGSIKQPLGDDTVEGRLYLIWKILGPAASDAQAADPRFRNLSDPKEIQKAFAGIDPNITVGQLFVDAITQLNALREISIVKIQQLPSDPAPINSEGNSVTNTQQFIKTMQSLSRLYIVVKTIKFVSATIRANVTEGNAPVIVELSALGTRDPNGATIPDANYKWDPDGDGSDGVTNNTDRVQCEGNAVGPVISCEYKQPGTYLVRLSVTSVDPNTASSGFAYLPIVVKPGLAQIVVKAKVNTVDEVLRQYEVGENGFKKLVIDKTEFHVTTEEARNGIEFNAKDSRGANNSELKDFTWNYGDGSQVAKGDTVTKRYNNPGRYPLSLEVTDRSNRKDRVSITVFVSSLAARVLPTKTISGTDELVEFDGSASHSDSGPINNYTWKISVDDTTTPNATATTPESCKSGDITNKPACVEIIGGGNGPRLQAKFQQPGIYNVELTVNDAKESASVKIPVQIKSRQPRAAITMRACPTSCPSPNDPSVVEFDSAGTFDPDRDAVLTYKWEFYNNVGDKLEPGVSTYQLLPTSATQSVSTGLSLEGERVKVVRARFARPGKYKVVLTVNDSFTDSRIRQEHVVEKNFEITSIVKAEWNESMQSSAQLNNNRASITFSGTLTNADTAELDFGDGESADITVVGSPFRFSETHVYDKAQEYTATLRANSDENGENEIIKKITIAPGDEPRAVIRVFEDDTEISLPEAIDPNNPQIFEVIRGVRLSFDATQSLSSTGSRDPTKLNYSWDFGDGDTSTKEKITHTYSELTNEDAVTFIKLTVSEKGNLSKKHTAQFPLRVVSSKPKLTALTIEKQSSGNTTPVEVLVRAEGALDADGRVTNYQFWYYHPDNPDERYAVLDTPSNQAELTVETFGDEGQENEFVFCVALTDSDNGVATCDELVDENRRPRLLVKNGPNNAPKASFEVAPSTTVHVGEELTFTSSSKDDDGEIKQYIWDLEGDGFQNNNPSEASSITHKYDRKSPTNGYKVKLKVIDDKNAAGYSREVPIFVVTPSNPPRVNFRYESDASIPQRVRFFDASTPDQQNQARIVKWQWDFDTSQEFGCTNDNKPTWCNGDKTDDVDSTDQFPVFDFPTNGRYNVKLTVTDNFDSEASVTQFVEVRVGGDGATGDINRPRAQSAQADLKAYYANRFSSFEGQIKSLHIPANACSADVALYWGDSRANDVPLFKLDKNIYHDANGDGDRTNDQQDVSVQNECVLAGIRKNNCVVMSFNRFDQQTTPRGSGQFEPEIAMYTQARAGVPSQIIDKDSVKIIFDKTNDPATELTASQCTQGPNTLGASLFTDVGMTRSLILSVIGGILVVATLFGIRSYALRGKVRVGSGGMDQK